MPFELEAAPGGPQLVLSGKLNVQQAGPLWEALQPSIAAKKTIRLQAAELQAMDTSIVQILCRLNCQLQIGATSDGFLASLRGRGLEQFFLSQTADTEVKRTVAKRQPAAKIKSRDDRRTHGKKNSRSR